MNTMRTIAISFAIGLVSGLVVMGWLRRPQPIALPKPDQAAPAVQLPGGKTEVEVKKPVSELPHVDGLPQTQTTVRRIELEVQPDPVRTRDGEAIPEIVVPPVSVVIEFIRKEDGHLRAVVSVDGGKLVRSVDVPVESQPITAPVALKMPRQYHWAALAERVVPINTSQAPTWGAQLLYSRGPFIGGIAANRYEGRILIGMQF